MKELGKLLKAERERQNFTLEDMASRTKIHIQKLIDIEEGNKEALPAKVFCMGLIKSYARELKIDMGQIDELCQQAFNLESVVPLKKKEDISPDQTEQESQPVGRFKIPKAVGLGSSIALCLALLFVILQVVEKMNSYSQEEALPQEVFTPSPVAENEEAETIQEVQDQPSDETSPKAPSKTPEAPNVSEKLAAEKARKIKKIETKPAQKEEKKIDAVAENKKSRDEDFSEDNFNDLDDEPVKTIAVADNKLILTALEPVRAEVVWSDGYVQVMLLKGQETKTLVFSKPITLRVNNGGAVQVSFNDSEKKVPGTFNQPIELSYP